MLMILSWRFVCVTFDHGSFLLNKRAAPGHSKWRAASGHGKWRFTLAHGK